MVNKEYGGKGTTPLEQVADPYERNNLQLDRIKENRHSPIVRRDGVYIGDKASRYPGWF